MKKTSNFDFRNGEMLLFNKPLQWTSFDLVNKVRYLIRPSVNFEKIKIGHAGTLDPLAGGLMILCTGKKTKDIEKYQGFEKEYIATITLGATTPSFDLETTIDKEYEYSHINLENFEEILQKFLGTQEQLPTLYSAKKIDGVRAYTFARQGKEKEIKPSIIEIKELEVLDFQLPIVKLRVLCGKGTYIRCLARDIGFALQSGAYLSGLSRTRIGNYKLEYAYELSEFENLMRNI